jgi:hypothetical protein
VSGNPTPPRVTVSVGPLPAAPVAPSKRDILARIGIDQHGRIYLAEGLDRDIAIHDLLLEVVKLRQELEDHHEHQH